MAARSQTPERRKQSRRNEDIKPMERLSAVEKETRALSKTMTRHMVGCESAAAQNANDNAKIIQTQGEQGVVLIKLQEVLPWIEQSYADKKARDQMWHKIGDFVGNMARKNWDSLSGKLIFVALGAILVWRGASWTDVLKMFGG